MAAPEIVHELLDRAWDGQADVGADVRIFRVARPGERYVAETHNGDRRLATPEMQFTDGEGWEAMERAPRPWVKVDL